jgi:single-stranded DNA-specific DHH superfamily exonuclease
MQIIFLFFKEARKMNIPIVWIDHHEVLEKIPKFVNYYNPLMSGETHEPVTALCYDTLLRKEDLWISIMGCVADKYLPKEYNKFLEEYPELGVSTNEPYDVLYKSEIGKASRIIRAGLMDKTTNVVLMMKNLMKAKSPNDILEENLKNKQMHKRFEEINSKYQKYLGKAIEGATEDLIFHKYSGDLSISSELSNELFYRFPEKKIVVCYVSPGKVNISARGEDIKEIVLKSIEGLKGATGGGHECAVGAQIRKEDLDKFEITLRELLKKDKYINK